LDLIPTKAQTASINRPGNPFLAAARERCADGQTQGWLWHGQSHKHFPAAVAECYYGAGTRTDGVEHVQRIDRWEGEGLGSDSKSRSIRYRSGGVGRSWEQGHGAIAASNEGR